MGNNRVKIQQVGYEAESFNETVDANTKREIQKEYSIEDEIKILRRAIKKLGVNDEAFEKYYNYVENKINKSKQDKKSLSNVNAEIKINAKKCNSKSKPKITNLNENK